MTDYARGYTTSWRVRRIDEEMWLPVGEVGGIDAVTVKTATADGAPLLMSGDIEATGKLDEGWYRVDVGAGQGSSQAMEPIATLLLSSDGAEWERGTWGGGLSGRSVLAYAAERKFAPGEYAPKGSDGAAFAAKLLRECIPAPVSVEGSFALSEHVVFNIGATYLDGVWQILNAAGWCMQIAGDGEVAIKAKPTEPAIRIGNAERGLLMPTISKFTPISNVPNVFKAYENSQVAVARNDDPSSPTSTMARGREIQAVEDSPSRIDGESLQAYAERRLSELSAISEKADIERSFTPGIRPYDIVRVDLVEQEMIGDYMVLSQTIECSHGVTVGETWGRMAK